VITVTMKRIRDSLAQARLGAVDIAGRAIVISLRSAPSSQRVFRGLVTLALRGGSPFFPQFWGALL